jgi:hypothetical protein
MSKGSRKRDLGAIDAAVEKHLADFFVESPELSPIFTNSCSIVSGTKGSGKTAIRRAYEVEEIYRKQFFAVRSIDLDMLSFSALFAAILRINTTANAGEVAIARNIWRHVLTIYALEAYSDRCLFLKDERQISPEDLRLAEEIHKYLFSLKLRGKKPTTQLLSFIEMLWVNISKLGRESSGSDGPLLLGLLPEQIDLLQHYPAFPEMHAFCEKVASRLKKIGTPLLICLDGLDSIIDYSKQSRNCIFAGLIDAVYKHTVPMTGQSEIADYILVKALLPLELSRSAYDLILDLDKVMQTHEEITWGVDSLKELVRKRLVRYTRSKSDHFTDVWHEVMPEKIRNQEHKVDEFSFDYILRHTLFRPRQLIVHIQEILDAWDSNYSSTRVDTSFIPPIVANTNVELVKFIISELRVVYPELEGFLKSWYGAPNLISYSDFRSRIERHFCNKKEKDSAQCRDLEHILSDFYSYGLFGISLEQIPTTLRETTLDSAQGKGGHRPLPFQFCFPHTSQGSSFLSQASYGNVAFSPMFHEYCRMKPVADGYITIAQP